jgi:hypothetical protein
LLSFGLQNCPFKKVINRQKPSFPVLFREDRGNEKAAENAPEKRRKPPPKREHKTENCLSLKKVDSQKS